jgi:hypothetical protein
MANDKSFTETSEEGARVLRATAILGIMFRKAPIPKRVIFE